MDCAVTNFTTHKPVDVQINIIASYHDEQVVLTAVLTPQTRIKDLSKF
jgi:hypothetical protein